MLAKVTLTRSTEIARCMATAMAAKGATTTAPETAGATTTFTATTTKTTAFATATALRTLRRFWLQALDHGYGNTLVGQRFDGAHFHAITMFGKGNGFTGTTGTAGTADTVHVVFSLHRQAEVENVRNGGHVDTAGSDVGRHENSYMAAT